MSVCSLLTAEDTAAEEERSVEATDIYEGFAPFPPLFRQLVRLISFSLSPFLVIFLPPVVLFDFFY